MNIENRVENTRTENTEREQRHAFYVEQITEAAKGTTDLDLLDLVYKMLVLAEPGAPLVNA